MLAAMARLSARFRRILAVALATGACAGGCSTAESAGSILHHRDEQRRLPSCRHGPSSKRRTGGEPCGPRIGRNRIRRHRPMSFRKTPRAVAGSVRHPPRLRLGAAPIITGPVDTALESLFGEASTSDWTPLFLSELFTAGWNQPFVFSPPSDWRRPAAGMDQCGQRGFLSSVGARLQLSRSRRPIGKPRYRHMDHLCTLESPPGTVYLDSVCRLPPRR